MNTMTLNNDFISNRLYIKLQDELLSEEPILIQLKAYLANIISADNNSHKTGFVFHTGSVCYDALVLAYSYLMTVEHNEDSYDMISSLKEGDMVLHNGRRKRFKGITTEFGGKHIKLESDNVGKDVDYVPEKKWNKIKPYHGESTIADGRGIRKESKETGKVKMLFAKELCGSSEPTVFDSSKKSIVVCMMKDRAEFLYDSISFVFTCPSDGKKYEIKLKDLATATFYTENNEYQLRNNTSKSEAIIQITADGSVARQLLRSRTDNQKVGIIIGGEKVISRDQDDIFDLLTTERISFSILSLNISSVYVNDFVKEFNDEKKYICTKEFLNTFDNSCNASNNVNLKQLHNEIKLVTDNENKIVELDCKFDRNECYNIKRYIGIISKDDYESEDKDQFIIFAYSMLNLFLHSCFTIREMDNAINRFDLSISSAENRINDLKRWSRSFPDNIKDKANYIINCFEEFYSYAYDRCSKKRYLENFIRNNKNKRIAIILDKKYYISVMRGTWFHETFTNKRNVFISTAAGFDNNQTYNYIISIGFVSGKKINLLNCHNAPTIMFLTYPFEKELLNIKIKKHREYIKQLNSSSSFPINTEVPVSNDFDSIEQEQLAVETEITDVESEDLIEILKRKYIAKDYIIPSNSEGSSVSKAIRIAKLDTGDVAYFSERYKAYVYDETEKRIDEVEVQKLAEGDTLVFTQYNSDTKDIVELIMHRRIKNNKYLEDEKMYRYIEMSKYWKTILLEYKKENSLKSRELADLLKKQGCMVQTAAIRSWLDEDAHIICPRNTSSLQAIAKVCKDDHFLQNVEAYEQACKEVKKERKKILKDISEAIRDKLCGIVRDSRKGYSDIYDKFDDLVYIASIESLADINKEIPLNKINKPLD